MSASRERLARRPRRPGPTLMKYAVPLHRRDRRGVDRGARVSAGERRAEHDHVATRAACVGELGQAVPAAGRERAVRSPVPGGAGTRGSGRCEGSRLQASTAHRRRRTRRCARAPARCCRSRSARASRRAPRSGRTGGQRWSSGGHAFRPLPTPPWNLRCGQRQEATADDVLGDRGGVDAAGRGEGRHRGVPVDTGAPGRRVDAPATAWELHPAEIRRLRDGSAGGLSRVQHLDFPRGSRPGPGRRASRCSAGRRRPDAARAAPALNAHA